MNIMKNKKRLFSAILLLGAILIFKPGLAKDLPVLMVFHSPTCHKCIEVKNEVLPEIEDEFKDKVRIEYYDIFDTENYLFMVGLKEKYSQNTETSVPLFFMNGEFLAYQADIKNNLKSFINAGLSATNAVGEIPEVNLVSRFNAIRPLAIIGAGLTDGINPCAFTVIVFFISYLALQGYKKVQLVFIGLAFISSVFLTYLLIGLGIFNFLYQLKGFWIFAKVFNISIGVFSIVLGILAFYDFFKFRKNPDPDALLLQLPKSVKNQIHAIIARHYRKAKDSGEKGPEHLCLGRLILSAFITGFLVSLLEAVCTGQLYLPTITFILKTTPLKLKAFVYLVVYNIMFIIPLLIIFLLALLGITSKQFGAFIRKHMLNIKILMAVLFISLGIFLIWRG